MTKDIKTWVKIALLCLFYISLAIGNIYINTLIFLFPLIALPMTIYLMANQIDINKEIIMNSIIISGIWIISGELSQGIIYGMIVLIPSYLLISYYKKGYMVPQIMIKLGIIMGGLLIAYVMIAEYFGISYIGVLFESLDQYKAIQIEVFEQILQEQTDNINLIKEQLNQMIDLFKILYPAIFLMMSIMMSAAYIGLVTLIGRFKHWKMPSLKQIFYFRLSRVAIVCLIIGVLISQMGTAENMIAHYTGLNIYFFLNYLFQIVGFFAAIKLLLRPSVHVTLRILGIIACIIIFNSMPIIMATFGIMDSLFNYRKVKIVV